MGDGLTKSEILDAMAKKSGLNKKQVVLVLDTLAEIAYKEAKYGFTVPGIGKLLLKDKAARVGRNPRTGAPVNIPAKKAVKFRVAKQCKDAILNTKK